MSNRALIMRLCLLQTRAVNPKAEVSHTTTVTGSQPIIHLDFSTLPCVDHQRHGTGTDACCCCSVVNGSKKTMTVPGKNIKEIFDDVDFFCSQIETEYEEQGKSID